MSMNQDWNDNHVYCFYGSVKYKETLQFRDCVSTRTWPIYKRFRYLLVAFILYIVVRLCVCCCQGYYRYGTLHPKRMRLK